MSGAYEKILHELERSPRHWVITGVAGFIGSHLLEKLLKSGQKVSGLDNFSTGNKRNLEAVREIVGAEHWKRFTFLEGDIRDAEACRAACKGANVISHQAALASVPRSLKDPAATTAVNVDGFVQIMLAARDAGAKRIVYASSSSVYGDSEKLPKVENEIGKCLSPYALSKYTDELYADVFNRCYGLEPIGLRYFNVFGPRQDPDGPYAAVMPRWVKALTDGAPCEVYGDGETSRDFCFVDNAVQANILAGTVQSPAAINQAYNIAVGDRTTLNELYTYLAATLGKRLKKDLPAKPIYKPFRDGDIRHSLASIDKAQKLLGYAPQVKIAEGIERTV